MAWSGLAEALRYLREGRIRSVYIGSSLISFLIQGDSGPHTVIFDLRLRRVSCSCWGFTVHKKCKHVLCALVYLKRHHPDAYRSIATSFPELRWVCSSL